MINYVYLKNASARNILLLNWRINFTLLYFNNKFWSIYELSEFV